MTTKHPYTEREIALAKKLYVEALAAGTLKPPRALGVLVRSNGPSQIARGSTVTEKDYLPDARRALEKDPSMKP